MNMYEYVQFEICQFRSPRVEYPWWGLTLPLSVSPRDDPGSYRTATGTTATSTREVGIL